MNPAIVMLAIAEDGTWNSNVIHEGAVPAESVIHALQGLIREIQREGLSPKRTRKPTQFDRYLNEGGL